MSSNCTEKFLKDVTDVFVFASSDLSIPLPFSIPNIRELNIRTLPAALLHLTKNNSEGVECETITVRESSSASAFPHCREHAVSALIEQDITRVRDAYNNIKGKDCVVLYHNELNERYLIYALPATFNLTYNDTVGSSLTLEMKMQSLSSAIKVI